MLIEFYLGFFFVMLYISVYFLLHKIHQLQQVILNPEVKRGKVVLKEIKLFSLIHANFRKAIRVRKSIILLF